jgi:cytochrome P450
MTSKTVDILSSSCAVHLCFNLQVCDKVMRLYRTNKANDPSLSGRTLLADLLDAHEYPSRIAKLSEVAGLIFAGHDTTAFTLCFFLMEISRHPDVKMKLQDELATVMPLHSLQAQLDGIPSSGSSEESIQDDIKLQSAIAGLEYFGWCINEIMRLW